MAGISVITENSVDRAAKEFFTNLTTESRVDELDANVIKTDWADEIIKAIHYLDNIFGTPKRFLKVEELIVDIEKSKKTDIDSVKHLARHSNMINDYDEVKEEIKPSRILNSFKEDTFDLYENRFAYSLVHLIEDVMYRVEQSNKNKKSEVKERLYYGGLTRVEDEDIDCRITMAALSKFDEKDGMPPRIKRKFEIIKNALASWTNSALYKELKKINAPMVSHPIKRTNTILKNPNFQVAVALWDYLYDYNIGTSEDAHSDSHEITAMDVRNLINNSLLVYYLVMKALNHNTAVDASMFDTPLRKAALDVLEAATTLLANLGKGMNKEELLSEVAERYDHAMKKKGLDASQVEDKIKTTVKEYLDKVSESFFSLNEKHGVTSQRATGQADQNRLIENPEDIKKVSDLVMSDDEAVKQGLENPEDIKKVEEPRIELDPENAEKAPMKIADESVFDEMEGKKNEDN